VQQYLRQNALTLEGWGYTNKGCLCSLQGRILAHLRGLRTPSGKQATCSPRLAFGNARGEQPVGHFKNWRKALRAYKKRVACPLGQGIDVRNRVSLDVVPKIFILSRRETRFLTFLH
jgi:hypothetical protein